MQSALLFSAVIKITNLVHVYVCGIYIRLLHSARERPAVGKEFNFKINSNYSLKDQVVFNDLNEHEFNCQHWVVADTSNVVVRTPVNQITYVHQNRITLPHNNVKVNTALITESLINYYSRTKSL